MSVYISFLFIITSSFIINNNNNNINSILILLILYTCQIITDNNLTTSLTKYKHVIFGTTASLLISSCLQANGIINIISDIITVFIKLPSFYLFFTMHLFSSVASLFLSNVAVVSILIPAIKITCSNDNILLYKLMCCIIHGASCCFASPTGYHTNLLINSIAGYQCKDFMKVGIPLHLITSITFSITIYNIL